MVTSAASRPDVTLTSSIATCSTRPRSARCCSYAVRLAATKPCVVEAVAQLGGRQGPERLEVEAVPCQLVRHRDLAGGGSVVVADRDDQREAEREHRDDDDDEHRELGRRRFDLGREGEVFVGDAALVVGRERHAHLAVADVEIRVVVGLLGEVGDRGSRMRSLRGTTGSSYVFTISSPSRDQPASASRRWSMESSGSGACGSGGETRTLNHRA